MRPVDQDGYFKQQKREAVEDNADVDSLNGSVQGQKMCIVRRIMRTDMCVLNKTQ